MKPEAATATIGPGTCELTGCRTSLDGRGKDGREQGSAERPRLLYVTDPLCSGCQALEPAWRRLLYRFGAEFSISYIYGGLLPSWEGFVDAGAGISVPGDVAAHWDAVSRSSRQPIDSRVWLSDPPASSYPASIAGAAVRLVAPEQEGRYLRRLRELVFLERQNIARPEVLHRALEAIDIDVDGWRAMLDTGAAERAFAADRGLVRGLGVRVLPTLLLDGRGLAPRPVAEGSLAPHALERALLKAAAGPLTPRPAPRSAAAVLEAYGTGTSAELAAALDVPVLNAERELTRAGARRRTVGDGAVWR